MEDNVMIRKATKEDIPKLNELLFQVQGIHAIGRPDIFKGGTKKYTSEELQGIIEDTLTPVYVYTDDGGIKGYVFCVFQETLETNQLHYRKTLYIDDLCVDKEERGKHIGIKLYEYARSIAKENGCNSVTLNVWALNEPASHFYNIIGLTPLKITMEEVIV